MLDMDMDSCTSCIMSDDYFPRLADLPMDGNPWIDRFDHIVSNWLNGALDSDDAYYQARSLAVDISEEATNARKLPDSDERKRRLKNVRDCEPCFRQIIPLQSAIRQLLDTNSGLSDSLPVRQQLFDRFVADIDRSNRTPRSR